MLEQKQRGPIGQRIDVLQLLTADPNLSNAEVGRRLGLSRQRVMQMRREGGLPASQAIRRIGWHPCLRCGIQIPPKRKYCSRACQWDYIQLTCDECGKEFQRPRSKATRYEHHLCSQTCKGSWLKLLRQRKPLASRAFRRLKNLVGN
jgi:predicted nucleic acid-binding Zn ribbon protein